MVFKLLRFSITFGIIVFFVSIQPSNLFINKNVKNIDKVMHVLTHGILSFTLLHSFLKQIQYKKLYKIGIYFTIIISFVFGLILEIYQQLYTSRRFDIYDIFANILGVFIGIITFYLIYGRVRR